MKKLPNSLNLKCARPPDILDGSLEFNLGTQSALGLFFNAVLMLGYTVVLLLLISPVFGSFAEFDNTFFAISGDFSISLGAIILFFALSVIAMLYFSNNINLLVISFLVLLSLLLVLWFFGLYFRYESGIEPVLLYLPLMIIVAHVGRYIVVVRKGDRLNVRLLPGKYEIFYRHNKVGFGVFSQNDIEIKHVNDGERNHFEVIFLPVDRLYPNFQQAPLFLCSEFSEVVADLGRVFIYLHMPYDSDYQKVENGDSSRI